MTTTDQILRQQPHAVDPAGHFPSEFKRPQYFSGVQQGPKKSTQLLQFVGVHTHSVEPAAHLPSLLKAPHIFSGVMHGPEKSMQSLQLKLFLQELLQSERL